MCEKFSLVEEDDLERGVGAFELALGRGCGEGKGAEISVESIGSGKIGVGCIGDGLGKREDEGSCREAAERCRRAGERQLAGDKKKSCQQGRFFLTTFQMF